MNANTAILGAIKLAEGTPISPFGPLNTGLISIMITLLIIAMRNQITNRKMTIQVNGEVRQEFIDEMAALRGEVKSSREESEGLRDEVRTLRQEVRKRDDKIDQLRDEVRSLNEIITGMSRQNTTAQVTTQRMIADVLPHSPEIDRALRSLGNVEGDGKL